MHKKSFFGGVLLLLFLTFVSPSQGGVSLLGETFPEGQAYGKVARVSGAHLITLELDLKHPFKVGDQLDLTYMAGMMPLPLGVFEVTSCQGKLVTVRPVTVMPDPRQGMQVIASIRRPDAREQVDTENHHKRTPARTGRERHGSRTLFQIPRRIGALFEDGNKTLRAGGGEGG